MEKLTIIKDLCNDEAYNRLLNKFKENKEFGFGKQYNTTIYCYEDGEPIEMDERALGKYIDAIRYEKISLNSVPKKLRTEEFYINTFYYTYDYIKRNIDQFDREFFKSLIMSNSSSLEFNENCFEIMPIEYIDEEMVSLAVLSATNWCSYEWLLTVYKRKPECISKDVWTLAARLYGGRNFKQILDITPKEYQTEEWYLELFKCRYNVGVRCDGRDHFYNDKDKTVLMDYVPKEVLTPEFLIKLLKDNPNNIARFSDYALEKEINTELGKMKIWKYVIKKNGYLIDKIDLNEERIAYFKSIYDKDSNEYCCFKYQYRNWKMKNQKTKPNNDLSLVLLDAMMYAREGENPSKAIDNEVKRNRSNMQKSLDTLPIFYTGLVPYEYKKEYDQEEFLQMMYEKCGIKIIEEYDYLLYRVELPIGYTVEYNGCFGRVKDENGIELFSFNRDDKFYDRSAEVTFIDVDEIINKKSNMSKKLNKPQNI